MKSNSVDIHIEPYQPMFTLGILAGLTGVSLWPLYQFKIISFYPGPIHSQMMFGFFLMSFVVGFLMTALPRFTATPQATKNEIYIATLFLLLGFVSILIFHMEWMLAFRVLTLVTLFSFAVPRFIHRAASPPPSFIFVGAGLLLALISNLLQFFIYKNWFSINLLPIANEVYFSGFITCLIIGIGSRLIPALFGFDSLPNTTEKMTKPQNQTEQIILLFIFLSSFVLFYFQELAYARLLRAIIFIYIALKIWRLYKLPVKKSFMTFFLWVACWLLILGQVLSAAISEQALQMIHLTLIGGFSLITLMIASRVTLSHGGHSIENEKTSKFLFLSATLITFAALTRFSALFSPLGYETSLLFSSLLWLTAVVLWSVEFVKKLWVKGMT